MAIINRNLDGSEKKSDESFVLGAVATGVTSLIKLFAYDSILQGVNLAAFGLSGAPQYSLSILRSAGGQTSIPLGVTFVAQAFGTSGPVGATISAPGFSCLAGDMLVMTSGVANTAILNGIVNVVYSGLADIKLYQNTVG